MSVKKTVIIVTICIFHIISYSQNLYKEYEIAKQEYKNNDLEISQKRVEKILNEFDDYKEANVLYFKILYQNKEMFKLKKIFEKISNYEDDLKREIYEFLLDQNDILRLEMIYELIENKENIKESFTKKLYENKKYNMILQKYQNEKYIALIEKDKSEADENYYASLENIKKNKPKKSIELLKIAIKKYPINYRYYFKLAQLYADNKNYKIAEMNFKKALEIIKKDEIYLNLFRLYIKTNEREKLYTIAKNIISFPEVQNELQKKYKNYTQEEKVKVLKKENNMIYISNENFGKLEIGNTYFLEKKKEKIIDEITGEKLLDIKEKIAKIRVIDKKEKITILYILNEYKNINMLDNYIIY